jgi:hypothetical protein
MMGTTGVPVGFAMAQRFANGSDRVGAVRRAVPAGFRPYVAAVRQ